MLCILEDNDARIQQFQTASKLIAPEIPVRTWRSAHVMIDDLVDCLEHASLISLDHDLNRMPSDVEDPGCGYDVVKLLVELHPVCPLIIHTSNDERGNWMVGELERTNWRFKRVYPIGDEWIFKEWMPLARNLLIK